MDKILNLDSVDLYNKLYGLETLNPLVSVIDLNKATTTNIKEDLLATERKILNNNRVIKAFTLSILICIILRNHIFLLKVEHNFIYTFLHINKIKVV